jgi:putative inorganic carbon (hco3(-)) transporter
MFLRRLSQNQYIGVYLLVIIYLFANLILLKSGVYYLAALPLLLIVLGLAIFSLDTLLLLTVLLVPFSIELSDLAGRDLPLNLSIPSEPMLALISLIVVLKALSRQMIKREILLHPVSLAIYFYIFWIFVTSITSTMPVISLKFLVSKIWFIIPFYFLAAQMFTEKSNMQKYIGLSAIPLMIIIFYVLYRHTGFGLTNQQASHFVVRPFYNDHTSYGAVLVMLFPVLAGFFLIYFKKSSWWIKAGALVVILIFLIAIIFSYTRAAWLSMGFILIVWLIIRMKIRWQVMVSVVLLSLALLFSYRTEIKIILEGNEQASSGKFTEHLQSMANIRNDASNVERINRWKSAMRMFKERPLTGWGPGTYMFNYAAFQMQEDKTIISTNDGNRGNAHSEYLGPLSETGLPGMISIFIIIALSVRTGLRLYYKTADRKTSIMALSILLGLISYYIHGLLNNFLDTDKASVLFWGFTGMLVAMDIKMGDDSLNKC